MEHQDWTESILDRKLAKLRRHGDKQKSMITALDLIIKILFVMTLLNLIS